MVRPPASAQTISSEGQTYGRWLPTRGQSRADSRRPGPGRKEGETISTAAPEIETYDDPPALVNAVGDRLAEAIRAAIAARGRALIVLSGGRNGIALLRRLGEHAQQIDWGCVQLFFGDDRFVPADDIDRNEKQAREALLDHIDIPAGNVHAMPASGGEFGDDLDAAAQGYADVLAATAEPGQPAPDFDVHMLGVGPEGHVNSMFPDTPAVRETTRMVVGVPDSPKPPPHRITLTLPAIQRARQVWMVVSGTAKANAVAAAIAGADPVSLPAAGAIGREKTIWWLDVEAAAEIPR